MKNVKISNNVIRRMPRYLRKLDELSAQGVERISSNELGRQLGLTPSQIRQDFSCFGEFGQQGYGYNLSSLRDEIAAILGMDRGYQVVVIGVGNIGHALLDHFNFESCGFHLLAAFDVDTDLIGTTTKSGVPWVFFVKKTGWTWPCCAYRRSARKPPPRARSAAA